MDFNTIIAAISTVGFPIVCVIVLFIQNNKMNATIGELTKTLVENTTILKQLSNDLMQFTRKEKENECKHNEL